MQARGRTESPPSFKKQRNHQATKCKRLTRRVASIFPAAVAATAAFGLPNAHTRRRVRRCRALPSTRALVTLITGTSIYFGNSTAGPLVVQRRELWTRDFAVNSVPRSNS
jgi:hypothetical protein